MAPFFAMKEISGSTLTRTMAEMRSEGSIAPTCFRRRLLNAFGRLYLAGLRPPAGYPTAT